MKLEQSQQPKRFYFYDGITGAWLRLPWSFHLGLAILIFPIAFWGLPLIPFKNIYIRDHFSSYRYLIGGSFSAFFILSAILSTYKASLLKKKKSHQKRTPSRNKTKKHSKPDQKIKTSSKKKLPTRSSTKKNKPSPKKSAQLSLELK